MKRGFPVENKHLKSGLTEGSRPSPTNLSFRHLPSHNFLFYFFKTPETTISRASRGKYFASPHLLFLKGNPATGTCHICILMSMWATTSINIRPLNTNLLAPRLQLILHRFLSACASDIAVCETIEALFKILSFSNTSSAPPYHPLLSLGRSPTFCKIIRVVTQGLTVFGQSFPADATLHRPCPSPFALHTHLCSRGTNPIHQR